MATAIHIPIADLAPDAKSLVDRVLSGEDIVVDADGATVRISRIVGRTAAEILADPAIRWSTETLDEDWAKDLQEIIAMRHTVPDRDPWAE